MLEIYNEQVRDLLNPSSFKVKGGLRVREHPQKGFYGMLDDRLNRVLKCDVITFSFFFFAFQHFHDHISVDHDEKPSHTKFDMNWFMVAWDMVAWMPN